MVEDEEESEPMAVSLGARFVKDEKRLALVTVTVMLLKKPVPLLMTDPGIGTVVEVNQGLGPSGAGVYGTSAVTVKGKKALVVVFPEVIEDVAVIKLGV